MIKHRRPERKKYIQIRSNVTFNLEEKPRASQFEIVARRATNSYFD